MTWHQYGDNAQLAHQSLAIIGHELRTDQAPLLARNRKFLRLTPMLMHYLCGESGVQSSLILHVLIILAISLVVVVGCHPLFDASELPG